MMIMTEEEKKEKIATALIGVVRLIDDLTWQNIHSLVFYLLLLLLFLLVSGKWQEK